MSEQNHPYIIQPSSVRSAQSTLEAISYAVNQYVDLASGYRPIEEFSGGEAKEFTQTRASFFDSTIGAIRRTVQAEGDSSFRAQNLQPRRITHIQIGDSLLALSEIEAEQRPMHVLDLSRADVLQNIVGDISVVERDATLVTEGWGKFRHYVGEQWRRIRRGH